MVKKKTNESCHAKAGLMRSKVKLHFHISHLVVLEKLENYPILYNWAIEKSEALQMTVSQKAASKYHIYHKLGKSTHLRMNKLYPPHTQPSTSTPSPHTIYWKGQISILSMSGYVI